MNKKLFQTAKPLHIEEEEEYKEYSVTIIASYGVNAISQEDANQYVLHQFWNGNTNYTQNVEIKENK